jgi:IclR family transcriptional regulator, pca regulon regulatory protein
MSSETEGVETTDRDSARLAGLQSFLRGLQIIRAFGPGAERQTLAQLARRTGMTRATVRRYLHTLVGEDYAATDGKHFWLRPRILELGFSYLSSLPFYRFAQPVLEDLARAIDKSCSVGVLDGGEVVYVLRVPAQRAITMSLDVGTRLPAHVSAMGRVLLAALPPAALGAVVAGLEITPFTARTITDRGRLAAVLEAVGGDEYALLDQEMEAGVRSVAVPIRDRRGSTIAALGMSLSVAEMPNDGIRRDILPRLRAAAAAISAQLP